MAVLDDGSPDHLNIIGITTGILRDLDALRAGRISVADGRVRADLARQALRAVGYVLQGQKFLSERAKELASIEAPAE